MADPQTRVGTEKRGKAKKKFHSEGKRSRTIQARKSEKGKGIGILAEEKERRRVREASVLLGRAGKERKAPLGKKFRGGL